MQYLHVELALVEQRASAVEPLITPRAVILLQVALPELLAVHVEGDKVTGAEEKDRALAIGDGGGRG